MSSVQVSCVSQDGDNPLDATSVHPESYEAADEASDISRDIPQRILSEAD